MVLVRLRDADIGLDTSLAANGVASLDFRVVWSLIIVFWLRVGFRLVARFIIGSVDVALTLTVGALVVECQTLVILIKGSILVK